MSADLREEVEAMYLRWLKELEFLQEEKARGNLTPEGEHGLIYVKNVVKDLIAVLVNTTDFTKPPPRSPAGTPDQ